MSPCAAGWRERLGAPFTLGVNLSARQMRDPELVDDLSTGYASLESITHLDVDALKVDRTFIAGLGEDPRDEAVVEAVMLVADRLGLPVVAEGIETEEQARRLRGLGCRYGQGHLFARALEAAELEQMLEKEASGC